MKKLLDLRAAAAGALALALVSAAPCLRAQSESGATTGAGDMNASSSSSSNASDSLSHADKRFLSKAAEAGETEMQFSQLAGTQASNPDVRSYAGMMNTDHQQMASDLQALARQKGVDLKQTDVTSEHKYKSLSSKSGMDFDKDYISDMVSDHEDAVKLFQKESTDGKDADVKAFAAKYLPTLQQHLDKANSLKSTLGG